jgi:hypothetical protein
MASRPLPFAFLCTLVLALAVGGVGCPCSGIVNSSDSLRWWLFSNFGASKVCPEMQKRGMPLKLQALGPNSVGRFFPLTCQVAVNDATRTMAVTVTGSGYALLPVTRRIGFYAGISVEYRPDFRLTDDATYVWGRVNRMLTTPDLRITGVENKIVSLATQTPIGDVATVIGQSIVSGEIAKGFTVVHQDDGDDFALGELLPPAKPPRPFSPGKDHIMLATDVTEVHAASRDYLGPFSVDGGGAALFVRFRIAGAPLDYLVVDKTLGDMWRQSYERGDPIGPPPGQPISYGTAPIGDSQRAVPLNPGLYYVVVENKAPAAALGVPMPFESVGLATYAVEVGDRP